MLFYSFCKLLNTGNAVQEQFKNERKLLLTELRSGVKVEVAVLGFLS